MPNPALCLEGQKITLHSCVVHESAVHVAILNRINTYVPYNPTRSRDASHVGFPAWKSRSHTDFMHISMAKIRVQSVVLRDMEKP